MIPKKKLLPIDELNAFAEYIRESTYTDTDGKTKYSVDEEDIIDELLDLYLLASARGQLSANEDIGTDIELEISKVESILYTPVGGKTWKDRVHEYCANGGTAEDLIRIADTESVRIYNASICETADESGSDYDKKWIAILDEKTRDSHDILSGTVVGKDEYFWSISGDCAKFPGGFETAEENANCRCSVLIIPK